MYFGRFVSVNLDIWWYFHCKIVITYYIANQNHTTHHHQNHDYHHHHTRSCQTLTTTTGQASPPPSSAPWHHHRPWHWPSPLSALPEGERLEKAELEPVLKECCPEEDEEGCIPYERKWSCLSLILYFFSFFTCVVQKLSLFSFPIAWSSTLFCDFLSPSLPFFQGT